MKYGLIGEKLGHSFSKEIHEALADYEYELLELLPEAVEPFIKGKEFSAINVTIPYKEKVIPYLDWIDEAAREIGAVNCILNDGGRLLGYNTDFFGMSSLLDKVGIDASGKVAAILGTGGTAKTARAVLTSRGAAKILTVSRTPKAGEIGYDELYQTASEVDIIINTTPVGMYPDIDKSPIDISAFKSLSGVIDAIYNPLRTKLVSEARSRGILAEGGLYMLVAQGVRASEIFTDKSYPEGELMRVFSESVAEKENIVLVGMPGSGKSTVGALLASRLGRELVDTDEIIVRDSGMSIPEIFEKHGESVFRDLESAAVMKAAAKTSVIIATGGGAPLRKANIDALRQNGRIYFLDRPLKELLPTEDRPLAKSAEDIKRLYSQRYEIYTQCADVTVNADASAEAVMMEIMK